VVGLAKFVLGVLLAIAILFFSGVTAARYLITRLTAAPPRPGFPNDNPQPVAPETPPAEGADAFIETAPADLGAAEPAATPAPDAATEAVPSEGYTALVTEPIGLILRESATQDSAQVGGLDFNTAVEVLETSADGEWQRVRVPISGREGWIKSGNTDPSP